MTLSIAWLRENKTGHPELIFASDSRLSSAGHVDICQKVFPLQRGDCAIAFCGATAMAYPFVLQLISAISNNKRMRDRASDFTAMPEVVCGYLNAFIQRHQDFLDDDMLNDLRGTSFLVGGWSWMEGKFIIRKITYQAKDKKKYVSRPIHLYGKHGVVRKNRLKVGSIGDYLSYYEEILYQKAIANGYLDNPKLDYEPLEALYEMLQMEKFTDRRKGVLYKDNNGQDVKSGLIGGAPQLVKVYPFMRAVQIGIRDEHGVVYDMGRPIEANEQLEESIFDLTRLCANSDESPAHSSNSDVGEEL